MPDIIREPIALRMKDLKGGRKSLYLDTYIEGVRKHSYEFLKLYLIPERTKADKAKNKDTLAIAQNIRAQRLVERARGKAGLPRKEASKVLLVDFIDCYYNKKVERGFGSRTTNNIISTKLHIIKHSGTNIYLSQVDKDFLFGFIVYLSKAKHLERASGKKKAQKAEKNISAGTASIYFGVLSSILKEAVREGLLNTNPVSLLSADDRRPIAYHGAHREYLTIEEVNRLAETECKHQSVKNAFLFSCFAGLRIGDVVHLRWSNIITGSDGRKVVNIRMGKTQDEVYVPLGKTALQYLPQKAGKAKDLIFSLPPNSTIQYNVKKWCKDAGIKKEISFHSSRHTFATMLLTKGADLYTTSKLLGHRDIKVTQIYADIIDEKKAEAINLLDEPEKKRE